MADFIEKLRNYISNRFNVKAYIEKQGLFTAITIIGKAGKDLIVCTRKDEKAYYAKIVHLKNLILWDCIHAIESPQGIFVFAPDLNELFRKIVDKLEVFLG
ncbi:MAG: hypothetical protein J7K21_06245 [Desulfurococcales archaeon]|nr:hypothetical protein [Desulfurococcales archaeon]